MRFTKGDQSFYSSSPEYSNFRENIGYIEVGLKYPFRVGVDVIEPEIAHYVQYFVGKFIKLKKGVNVYSAKDLKGRIGGLPSRKLVSDEYTTGGYKKGSSNVRRTTHALRPVEYYPDLLSSVRFLELDFAKKNPDYSHDPNDPEWIKKKQNYFSGFVKTLQQETLLTPSKVKSLPEKVFQDFKKVSKPFYNHMLKLAYDAFVNRHPNIDTKQLFGKKQEIESATKDTPKRTTSDDDWFLDMLNGKFPAIRISRASDFVAETLEADFEFSSDSEVGSAGEEILTSLGFKEKIDKWGDSLGFEYQNKTSQRIVNFFKKLKSLKDKNENIFGHDLFFDNNVRFSSRNFPKAYDILIRYFKSVYMANASISQKPLLGSLFEKLDI